MCPSVTNNDSAGIVTLSIVNYVVLCSNGEAFERVEVPGLGIGRRGKPKDPPKHAAILMLNLGTWKSHCTFPMRLPSGFLPLVRICPVAQ